MIPSVSSVSLVSPSGQPLIRSCSFIRDGQTQLARGAAQAALENFDSALRQLNIPQDALAYDALMGRAEALARLGRDPEALAVYRQLHSLCPGYLQPYQCWVRLMQKAGLADQAIDQLATWGTQLITARMPGEASLPLQVGLDLAPGNARLLILLATAQLHLGDYQPALGNIEQALRLLPHDPGLHASQGMLLNQLGRPRDALASFNAALRLDPNHRRALLETAKLLLQLRRPAQALTQIDRALELWPDDPLLYAQYTTIQRQRGRHEEALAHLDQAPETVQSHHLIHVARGTLHFELEQYEEALADYSQATEDGTVLQYKAYSLAHLARHHAALETVKKAEQAGNHSREVFLLKRSLERFMATHPNHPTNAPHQPATITPPASASPTSPRRSTRLAGVSAPRPPAPTSRNASHA